MRHQLSSFFASLNAVHIAGHEGDFWIGNELSTKTLQRSGPLRDRCRGRSAGS